VVALVNAAGNEPSVSLKSEVTVHLLHNSSVFYTCLLDVTLPEDDIRRLKHVRVLVDCM
jgi:hypothetical protein